MSENITVTAPAVSGSSGGELSLTNGELKNVIY